MTVKEKLAMLENPEFFCENRLAAVSDHSWYETATEAKEEKEMPLRYSLNGLWNFMWAPNPMSGPEGFEKPEVSCRGWDTIPVPGQMELNGYGIPQYTDTSYPWDGVEAVSPHKIPKEKNPVGFYVKYFTLPETYAGKRMQLHLEGAETAVFVWLNGVYIGYSEDSYTPAVFDITDAVKEGENKLAVEVVRFSSGTWLEDQDFWRMGGIVREVAVTALPEVHIRDIDADVTLSENYKDGIASVKLRTDAAGNMPEGIRAVWELYAPDGNAVQGAEVPVNVNGTEGSAAFQFEVRDAKLWSAEFPDRYQLLIKIMDQSGNVIEAAGQKLGFRKVEIIDAVLHFNGKRLVLNGVNRHEFSGTKGRAIGKEEMEWDIRFLKQNHFNAVRTCHYPNQTYWYELCDRYGIYVMDETNLETHGTWHMREFEHTLPGAFPEWKEACLSRAEAMLERDKNHPCIFSWSVGNESWSGQTLYDMSMYFRERDPGRPVHYENCCHDRNWEGTTDFESRMYATPEMAREYLEDHPKKPYVLCEYSHAMGNSCGNLSEYTALADRYPEYCGGFIWDYIDQSLEKTDPFGNRMLAYGGDFGDRPTDYNFCTDGLIYSDRGISPKVQEVKFLYQPYSLSPDREGVTVCNRNLFDDGRGLELLWKLERDGNVLLSDRFEFECSPLERVRYSVSEELRRTTERTLCDGGEYVISAQLLQREEKGLIPSGHEIAYGESVISPASSGTDDAAPLAPHMRIVDGDSTFSVWGEGFSVQYNKVTGRMCSYRTGTKELVYDPMNTLLPNFWRAPTDNDEGNKMKIRCAQWKCASLYPAVKEMKFEHADQTASVKVVYDLQNGAECAVTHQICGDGEIRVTEHYTGRADLPEMPCFGMTWKLPAEFDRVTWYGKGPDETYNDRCAGGRTGLFQATPSKELPGYVVPQECGNHVETRWIEVTDGQGKGIRITGRKPFEFSALPYTCHELEQARHIYELPRVYATVLRLNGCQTGVGGDNSWGAWAHPQYVVSSDGEKEFAFQIRPV